jgi:hypothetical protein
VVLASDDAFPDNVLAAAAPIVNGHTVPVASPSRARLLNLPWYQKTGAGL